MTKPRKILKFSGYVGGLHRSIQNYTNLPSELIANKNHQLLLITFYNTRCLCFTGLRRHYIADSFLVNVRRRVQANKATFPKRLLQSHEGLLDVVHTQAYFISDLPIWLDGRLEVAKTKNIFYSSFVD